MSLNMEKTRLPKTVSTFYPHECEEYLAKKSLNISLRTMKRVMRRIEVSGSRFAGGIKWVYFGRREMAT